MMRHISIDPARGSSVTGSSQCASLIIAMIGLSASESSSLSTRSLVLTAEAGSIKGTVFSVAGTRLPSGRRRRSLTLKSMTSGGTMSPPSGNGAGASLSSTKTAVLAGQIDDDVLALRRSNEQLPARDRSGQQSPIGADLLKDGTPATQALSGDCALLQRYA